MQYRNLPGHHKPVRIPSAAFRRRKRMRMTIAALGAALTASVFMRA